MTDVIASEEEDATQLRLAKAEVCRALGTKLHWKRLEAIAKRLLQGREMLARLASGTDVNDPLLQIQFAIWTRRLKGTQLLHDVRSEIIKMMAKALAKKAKQKRSNSRIGTRLP